VIPQIVRRVRDAALVADDFERDEHGAAVVGARTVMDPLVIAFAFKVRSAEIGAAPPA
jgi:hypothetical protein